MSLTTMTDLELVAEVKQGSAVAFRTLYYRHVDAVFGLVTRIIGPRRADREDVVQEVFLEAYRSLSRFRGESSFSTWLHRIAINVAYTHLRRSLRTKEEVYRDAYSASPFEDRLPDCGERLVDARRAVHRMFELIDQLSPKNRIVFVLYEFEGLTLDNISGILDIPLHTAAARLRRSRESLMQLHRASASLSKEEKR